MPIKSPGLKSETEFLEAAKQLDLTPDEAKALFFYQDRARKAFENREKNWEYFDGLTYYDDYVLNRQLANSFLRPKKNDDEVRVVSGVAEKKIEVILNELLALNQKGRLKAFDEEDNNLQELGSLFSDVVRRTNEQEKDEDLWREAYLEGLTQRAVFLMEEWQEEELRDKIGKWVGKRIIRRPRKRIISGLKVFLGDMNLPWYRFDEQPYIVIYDRVNYKQAEKMYGNRKHWKKVTSGNATDSSFLSMRYGSLNADEVEILIYYSACDDEMMTLCQGVPMDDFGTKLPWEYNGYNIKMFGLKTMSRDFPYMKPLSASSKVLQSLSNESIRLLIRKWRQALEPPIGARKKNIFSKDIWSASSITYGITKDDISKLIDHNGVTNAEMEMQNFIDKKTEEFIGASNQQQGLEGSGQKTAMEIQTLQRQFIKQLGLSVLMTMTMHRDMTYLRLYNVLEHATKPFGKTVDPFTKKVVDAYQSYTIEDADAGDGELVTKRVVFNDRSLSKEELGLVREEEEKMKKMGKTVRYYWINIQKLLQIPLTWYSYVIQEVKESDALEKVMFNDTIRQASAISQIAGRPLSGDAIIQEFERTWKKKDWFKREAPQGLMDMTSMRETGVGKMKPQQNEPTINKLANSI